MIKGLYEAHLPVKDLNRSIEFYSRIGLEMAYHDEDTAFFWIEKEKSWIGLWEGEQHETPYHPSLRHIAFRIDLKDMKSTVEWLRERDIEPSHFGSRPTTDPYVRLYQGNASVYFVDPDGNSLELMCFAPVPPELRQNRSVTIEEYEALIFYS